MTQISVSTRAWIDVLTLREGGNTLCEAYRRRTSQKSIRRSSPFLFGLQLHTYTHKEHLLIHAHNQIIDPL
uniref:Uncharacterized protein n=1 Tax=Parascaris equorum TaxID=6256 RepID=A0A914S2Q0_PAREQ